MYSKDELCLIRIENDLPIPFASVLPRWLPKAKATFALKADPWFLPGLFVNYDAPFFPVSLEQLSLLCHCPIFPDQLFHQRQDAYTGNEVVCLIPRCYDNIPFYEGLAVH